MNNRDSGQANVNASVRSVSSLDDKSVSRLTKHMSVPAAFFALADPVVGQVTARAHQLVSQGDAETLHKFRVALRQLRALWWAFAPLMDSAQAKLERDEFKRLAGVAGDTRDWDVLCALLSSARQCSAIVENLAPALAVQRELALSSTWATLKHADIETHMRSVLLGTLRQLEEHGDEPVNKFAETRVRKAEKALRTSIKQAHRHKLPDFDALHEVRIAGKKLRYLLEFFAPLLAGHHDKNIKRLMTFQTQLGNLNDVVVSEVKLRETPLSGIGENDLTQTLNWMTKEKTRRLRAAQRHIRRIKER
ncbi:CHAD domain-containing protein [Caballeronia sordidicola]|nr:CHAD domain-containing protein [Caballeronia sordidicola]